MRRRSMPGTVEHGHLHVERDDVRLELGRELEALLAVGGRPDDDEVARLTDEPADGVPHERGVVHDEDANGCHGAGSFPLVEPGR